MSDILKATIKKHRLKERINCPHCKSWHEARSMLYTKGWLHIDFGRCDSMKTEWDCLTVLIPTDPEERQKQIDLFRQLAGDL